MNKTRIFMGYFIVVAVLVICLMVMSTINVSPWFNAVAAILSVLAAIRFIELLSVTVVGLLVAIFTIALPLSLLFAMGADSDLSPLSYLGVIDFIQYGLPTFSAVGLLTLLKRGKAY